MSYCPQHFKESNLSRLYQLIEDHSFATIIVSSKEDGMFPHHLPLLLYREEGEFGVLRGHVARANPLWKLSLSSLAPLDILVIFKGGDAYISPSFYPQKKENGKVVPTWNYSVVHVKGTLKAIDNEEWVRNIVQTLTTKHETSIEPDINKQWKLDDAPESYVKLMLSAIVGIEIKIHQITGKFKLNQNHAQKNIAGVIAALSSYPKHSSEHNTKTYMEENLCRL